MTFAQEEDLEDRRGVGKNRGKNRDTSYFFYFLAAILRSFQKK